MDSEGQFNDFINKYKIPLALGLVGLVLLVGGIISSGVASKTFVKSSKTATSKNFQPQNLPIKVDVSGAVLTPGVYTLSPESRVEDALKLAGGINDKADQEYMTKSLNLAQKVVDGMKIYIPEAGEKGQSTSGSVAGVSAEATALININTASLAELDKLPGVGPVSAQNIVDKRPFGGIEELLTKKVVSRATYEKIKELVSVF